MSPLLRQFTSDQHFCLERNRREPAERRCCFGIPFAFCAEFILWMACKFVLSSKSLFALTFGSCCSHNHQFKLRSTQGSRRGSMERLWIMPKIEPCPGFLTSRVVLAQWMFGGNRTLLFWDCITRDRAARGVTARKSFHIGLVEQTVWPNFSMTQTEPYLCARSGPIVLHRQGDFFKGVMTRSMVNALRSCAPHS